MSELTHLTPDEREIARLASEATPGERTVPERDKAEVCRYGFGVSVEMLIGFPPRWQIVPRTNRDIPDAAYIAACDPTAVLTLLARLDGLRAALRVYAGLDITRPSWGHPFTDDEGFTVAGTWIGEGDGPDLARAALEEAK